MWNVTFKEIVQEITMKDTLNGKHEGESLKSLRGLFRIQTIDSVQGQNLQVFVKFLLSLSAQVVNNCMKHFI